MQKTGSLNKYYCALALAQCGIGINVVINKLLITVMPMLMLLACRFCLSTLFLGLLLRLTHTPITAPSHPAGKATASDWLYLSLQGLAAGFLFNVLFVWGLNYTSATAAGAISCTLPAIIGLTALWLLNERLSSRKVMALGLAISGILVLNLDYFSAAMPSHQYALQGNLLVLCAMFPQASYSILGRKLAGRITPLGGAFIANLAGLACLVPSTLWVNGPHLPNNLPWVYYGLIVLGASCSLMFFWGWSWGLSRIGASVAAAFGGVMPLTTTCLAFFLLGEPLHMQDMLGILLVIASVLVGANIGFAKPKPVITAN
jgi:drug/metabolite transporter (DMT)-like permease